VETLKEKKTVAEGLKERIAAGWQPAANLKMPAEKAATANQQKPAALPPRRLRQQAVQKKEAPVAKDKFLIQVVSYQKKSKADDLIGKLKSLGYASKIEVMDCRTKGSGSVWSWVVFRANRMPRKQSIKCLKALKGVHLCHPVGGKQEESIREEEIFNNFSKRLSHQLCSKI